MKNVANYISVSRIIMSIILFVTETFSIAFYIIYIYCGISDMLDGFIARKGKNERKIGARLDSVSDIIFVIVLLADSNSLLYADSICFSNCFSFNSRFISND